MNGYEKQIKTILTNHGWKLLRPGKGAYEFLGKNNKPVTVPHGCKSRHSANVIMKEAKINHKSASAALAWFNFPSFEEINQDYPRGHQTIKNNQNHKNIF